MESAASAEAYIANNYTVRVQTYSRANVSSEGSLTVDAKGYPISKWKIYNCICGGRGDDITNLWDLATEVSSHMQSGYDASI